MFSKKLGLRVQREDAPRLQMTFVPIDYLFGERIGLIAFPEPLSKDKLAFVKDGDTHAPSSPQLHGKSLPHPVTTAAWESLIRPSTNKLSSSSTFATPRR